MGGGVGGVLVRGGVEVCWVASDVGYVLVRGGVVVWVMCC